MDHCPTCGVELGAGRFCTNCGRPVDAESWRTDTAERSRHRPAPAPAGPPPPAWTPPPPVRFPLYADEVDPVEPAHQPPSSPPQPPAYVAPEPAPQRRRPWGLWVAGVAVLLLVAAAGVALVVGGDDPEPEADGSDAGVTNLAADARVRVPATAGPGTDLRGRPVAYDAENMLDGVPETAWRMAGSGEGREIVVTLPQESQLRSVGLINGYAKGDWYRANRRIEQVEWVFDDGTSVVQNLAEERGVQSVDVDVVTTTVTLRLLAVSERLPPPEGRDFTAISDLSLVGVD